MKILSFNPGHDGALAYLEDGCLISSVEAEKNSHYRYSPVSMPELINVLGELDQIPDVLCRGGWWPGDAHLFEQQLYAGYHGTDPYHIRVTQKQFLGKNIKHFSSSHERSHLLCAFGMSDLPKGTPCYALLWEGVIGSFYKIDAQLNLIKLSDVMPEPGHRYALLYGLADPTFDKTVADFSRFSDAGKLMALASFSKRSHPTDEEKEIIDFLLQDCLHLRPKEMEKLRHCRHYNVGLDDTEFRNFAGIVSDEIFNRFYEYAKSHLTEGLPLLISGGCGLNCDWNSKWRDTNFFSEIFVPPVANDSGSAIGTAIDAQFYFTGNPKIEWNVYCGLDFINEGTYDASAFEVYDMDYEMIAEILEQNLIIGWVNGKYEIGPRALGNRSILASPFHEETKVRLNEIKQREQFRPIAPVCLEEDAHRWFGCDHKSPYMLYTQKITTDKLAAVRHVNGTSRIQTVSLEDNASLYKLLVAFKANTGYGVLCNTSLNFNGRGFINNISDLADYALKHKLDGFVINDRFFARKDSEYYQTFLRRPL